MCEDDVDAVISLELISFTTPWTRTSFYEELNNPRSILKIAESNQNVIGYICCSHVHDEGHVLNLAVNTPYRRKGIASLLVEDSLAVLKDLGCKDVYLEVRASNRAAIEMYNTLRFKQVGRRKDYYRKPREDAVIMKLNL